MINSLCPICGIETKEYVDIFDGHILMEESNICPTGHYSYEYLTGVSEVRIGELTVGWTHNTPYATTQRCWIAIEKLIKRYKKRNNL